MTQESKPVDTQNLQAGIRQKGWPMLVVTRKEGESIVIGDSIVVSVSSIRGNRVRLAIEAPRSIRIGRTESAPRTLDRPHELYAELCTNGESAS